MSGRLDEVTPPPLDFPLLLPSASQHLSTKGPPDRQSSHLASPLRFDVGGLARSLGPNRPQHLQVLQPPAGTARLYAVMVAATMISRCRTLHRGKRDGRRKAAAGRSIPCISEAGQQTRTPKPLHVPLREKAEY